MKYLLAVVAIVMLVCSSCRHSTEEAVDTYRKVFDLYRLDVKSGKTTQLTDDKRTFNWAVFTSSGAMVSVQSDALAPYPQDLNQHQGLYYTLAGSASKTLLRAVEIVEFDPFGACGIHQKIILTNDEQKIIYCNRLAYSYLSSFGFYSQEICMINIDGSGFEQLVSYPYGKSVGSISLAPDGKHILYDEATFNVDATAKSSRIILLDLETKEQTVVQQFDSSLVLAPQYVPNTNDIVFYEGRTKYGADSLKLLHSSIPSTMKVLALANLISATNFPVISLNGLMTNFNKDINYELVDINTTRAIPLQMSATRNQTFIGLTPNGQQAVVATNGGQTHQFIIFNTMSLASTTIPIKNLEAIKLLNISDDGNTVLFIGEHIIEL